jgi:hypothetical protein
MIESAIPISCPKRAISTVPSVASVPLLSLEPWTPSCALATISRCWPAANSQKHAEAQVTLAGSTVAAPFVTIVIPIFSASPTTPPGLSRVKATTWSVAGRVCMNVANLSASPASISPDMWIVTLLPEATRVNCIALDGLAAIRVVDSARAETVVLNIVAPNSPRFLTFVPVRWGSVGCSRMMIPAKKLIFRATVDSRAALASRSSPPQRVRWV